VGGGGGRWGGRGGGGGGGGVGVDQPRKVTVRPTPPGQRDAVTPLVRLPGLQLIPDVSTIRSRSSGVFVPWLCRPKNEEKKKIFHAPATNNDILMGIPKHVLQSHTSPNRRKKTEYSYGLNVPIPPH